MLFSQELNALLRSVYCTVCVINHVTKIIVVSIDTHWFVFFLFLFANDEKQMIKWECMFVI